MQESCALLLLTYLALRKAKWQVGNPGNCASALTVSLRQKILRKVKFQQKLAHHFRNSGIQIVVGQTEIFHLMQNINCSEFVPVVPRGIISVHIYTAR